MFESIDLVKFVDENGFIADDENPVKSFTLLRFNKRYDRGGTLPFAGFQQSTFVKYPLKVYSVRIYCLPFEDHKSM